MKDLQQSLFEPGSIYNQSGKPVNSKQNAEWEKLLDSHLNKLTAAQIKLKEHIQSLHNNKERKKD